MQKFLCLKGYVCLSMLLLCPVIARSQTKIHYIDVGQADAILLEFEQAAVMIDAGGEATTSAEEKTHLINYLERFFARRTDLARTIHTIIISHPHLDHTLKLPDVVKTFKVLNLIDGGDNADSFSGILPLREAREFVSAHGGHLFAINDRHVTDPGFTIAALEALHSLVPAVTIKLLSGSRGCKNANNSSLVTQVTIADKRFLFTGDAEDLGTTHDCSAETTNLIARFTGTSQLQSDVLKIDHHGSDNGINDAWMAAIAPKISIISAGKIDKAHRVPGSFHAFQFGHPRESAVQRIEQGTTTKRTPAATVTTMNGVRRLHKNRVMEKAVYCTCWDGNIVVEPDSLTVKTQQ